jgi:O-antigen ligase
MFRHHPISGVGPGCYAYEFLPYRVDVQQRYAGMLRLEPTALNFGETHNDHLQVLAEGGAPGYAIFLAALLFAGSLSFSGIEEPLRTAVDERTTFAKLIAFPTTVSLLVLTLGQFPLHLVAPLLNALFLIAMCSDWSATDS